MLVRRSEHQHDPCKTVLVLLAFAGGLCLDITAMSLTTALHGERSDRQPPLPDALWTLLPKRAVGTHTALTWTLVAYTLWGAFVVFRRVQRPIPAFLHALFVLAILFTMRALTIVVTLTPSPYSVAELSWQERWVPRLLRYDRWFTTVGDNMFSAHSCIALVVFLALKTYVRLDWGAIIAYGCFLVVVLFWIIASHLHYSADVLVAIYITVPLWWAVRELFIPPTGIIDPKHGTPKHPFAA